MVHHNSDIVTMLHTMPHQVMASSSYPVDSWRDIGTFSAANVHGEQTFELPQPTDARYLKLKFLSHHGDDYYCTLSHIRVFGSTVLESLAEAMQENTKVRLSFTPLLTTTTYCLMNGFFMRCMQAGRQARALTAR